MLENAPAAVLGGDFENQRHPKEYYARDGAGSFGGGITI
jgi:hypothetical protein